MYLSRWYTTLFIPGAAPELDDEDPILGLSILLNDGLYLRLRTTLDVGEPDACWTAGHSSPVPALMEGQRNRSLKLGVSEVVGAGIAGESGKIHEKQDCWRVGLVDAGYHLNDDGEKEEQEDEPTTQPQTHHSERRF